MPDDEQRVRTMAGWIGVEISRSRVRTPGKAGYGLYRVRSAAERHWHPGQPPVVPAGEWTGYAFTLEAIRLAVEHAIGKGAPGGPQELHVMEPHATRSVTVPTRWTTAYRGRRDLGVGERRAGLCGRPERHVGECVCLADGNARWIDDEQVPVQVSEEFAALVSAVDSLVGGGLLEMAHVEDCACDDDRYTAACIRATATGRQRQRAHNRAFQAEHLRAREWGLIQRYAAKQERLRGTQHSEGQPTPQRASQAVSGGQWCHCVAAGYPGPHRPFEGCEPLD